MYCAVKAQVQQELKQCECMELTTDWTSRANDGYYISLTAHNVTPQFVMKHRNLQSCHFPGSHTAINLAAMLEKLANNWGINLSSQVLAFTADNARNVVNAISECLGLTSIPCAGHSINLAV